MHLAAPRWVVGALPAFVLAVVVLGCGAEPFSYDRPAGWEGEGTRWWIPGTDTTAAFRDLESLLSMNVEGAEYTYAADGSSMRQTYREQLRRAVKQSLIEIIRNEPEVVDSLLERVVMPKVVPTADESVDELVNRYQKEGYRSLSRHFREPRLKVGVGAGEPLVFPDSLRRKGVSGTVSMQVYLNADGEPQAIQLLLSVHPVLDALSMRATLQARWQPAYLLRGGKSDPIPAWVRYRIRYAP